MTLAATRDDRGLPEATATCDSCGMQIAARVKVAG